MLRFPAIINCRQMLEYRKSIRACEALMTPRSAPAPAPSRRIAATASPAAKAQSSGFERFNAMRKSQALRKSLSKSSVESTESTTDSSVADASKVDAAEMERRACLEDELVVDQQLDKYEAEGIIDEAHPEWAYFKLDLVRYWQV